MTEAATLHVEAGALAGFVRAIVAATGCGHQEAEEVAAHLLEANLQGHDSHGIMLLPRYVQHVREGKLHPKAVPTRPMWWTLRSPITAWPCSRAAPIAQSMAIRPTCWP